MKKKVIICSSIFVLIIFFIYYHFYYIDWSAFRYNFYARSVKSPDNTHKINFYLHGKNDEERDKKNDIYYGSASVMYNKGIDEDGLIRWKEKKGNMIYWEKDVDVNNIEIEWIDNYRVCINGKTLDIRWDKYDYRR